MTNKYPLQLKCINNSDACIYLTVGTVYNGYTLGGMVTLQLDDCNVSDRQYKSNRFELINKEKQMTTNKLYPLELKCIDNNHSNLTVGKVYSGYCIGNMVTLELYDCNVSDIQYSLDRFEIINKEIINEEKEMIYLPETINLPVHKTIIVNPLQFNTSTSRVIDAYMYDERIIHIEHSYEFNNSGDPHSSYTLCIDGTKISDKINKGFDIGTIDIYNITDIYTAIAVCNEINQYCFTKFLTECSNYTI